MQIITPKYKKGTIAAGVYKITFNRRWFYIGGSEDIHNRISTWRRALRSGRYKNSNIRKILNDNCFIKITITRTVPFGESKKHEDVFLKKYFNHPNCLNLCPSAYDCTGKRLPIGVVKPLKIKNISSQPKRIARFDKSGNLIDIQPSISSMTKSIGFPIIYMSEISRVAKGRARWFRGHVFKFVNEDGSFVENTFIRKNAKNKI